MPPIKHAPYDDDPATVYAYPSGGTLVISSESLAGRPRPVAEPSDGRPAAGLLIALDGTRLIRRVGRLVEKGEIDPARLPRIVGVDSDDALRDYTPWWQPAFREEAGDFGGGADDFLEGTVLPVTAEASTGVDGRVALMGYSLAGLLCLQALMRTARFDEYLIASPSSWYPGFVNKLARTPLAGTPRVIIACGRDEGIDHPEPIRGIRQDTDRIVHALSERLPEAPTLLLDEFDHHGGLNARIQALLARL